MSWISPLDCAHNHGADFGRSSFYQHRSQNSHTRFHSLRCHQNFRNEQDTIAEVNSDDIHTGNQTVGQNLIWFPDLGKELHGLQP